CGSRTTHRTALVVVDHAPALHQPRSPRIIGLPGHSPGSIATNVPVADALFVGDGMTTRHVLTGQQGPQPAPFTDDPQQAMASLERIEGTPATWVLPGHGPPWSGGVAEAVRRIRSAARQ